MIHVSGLVSSMSHLAGDLGRTSEAPVAVGFSVAVILGGLVVWLISLYIAYLIVKSGVRAGVQVLVDQGRVNRELLQAQNVLLAQLVKRDSAAASDPGVSSDASAADNLRTQ